MKLILTIQEAIDSGVWEEIRDGQGWDHYAIQNGLDVETEITIDEKTHPALFTSIVKQLF